MFRFISYILVFSMIITFPVFYIIALLIKILTLPFDRRGVVLHLFTCFWGSFYTWIMPLWRIKIDGRKNIRRKATYMVVSNHQSQLDILVNFRLFFQYKILSKAEIFKVPFMGWNMILNRYIKLKRGEKGSIDIMMKECEDHLREGSSVFIYPEGTRSKNGIMNSFKSGSFILAKKMQVPILPIIINGTDAALPKFKMDTSGIHRISVEVLKEIPYEAFKDMTVEETAVYVREIMSVELAAVRLEAEKKAASAT
ncbi:MAG: 1-acyl-sn-glycerol-3-phosphate acyltransferase [bacterium]|nr:1-acyl-sn-glycerol-3-phosphate acyltransferase [bacterium]